MTRAKERRSVTLCLDDRQWRGLRVEAELLEEVFGQSFTPEQVAQARLDRALSRVDRPRRAAR